MQCNNLENSIKHSHLYNNISVRRKSRIKFQCIELELIKEIFVSACDIRYIIII